ncbi:MAG TPA: flavin reductase family protein [Longimicrobiales bacterium]|nr:flavin reductase family protein [Longimicrobiales bacterium]
MTRRPIHARVQSGGGAPDDDAADAVRHAFALWASGVAVVTARDDDGRVYGMTVAALAPVSIDPPLVLACIHNDAPLASVLLPGVACGMSILTEGQKRAATTFADRFTVPGDLLVDEGDVPVVADAAATLLGTVDRVYDGGDHRIAIVRVEHVSASQPELPPLVYWRRGYRRLEPQD